MEKKQGVGAEQPRSYGEGNCSNPQSRNWPVHRDVVYLNEKAQENLKTHVQERLPEQYQKRINGLNQVLKIG